MTRNQSCDTLQVHLRTLRDDGHEHDDDGHEHDNDDQRSEDVRAVASQSWPNIASCSGMFPGEKSSI